MTLQTFQSEFAAVLVALPIFANKGFKIWDPKNPDSFGGIVVEIGNAHTRDGVNVALANLGFVVIVGRPASAEFQTADTLSAAQTTFSITLAENEEVNKAETGPRIDSLDALAKVISAVVATDTGNRGQRGAKPVSFRYGTDAEGVLESLATFRIPLFFGA